MSEINIGTFSPGSDAVFHRVATDASTQASSTCPREAKYRKFCHRMVRFASSDVAARAVLGINSKQLADMALYCHDSSEEQAAYWLEILSFRLLRVSILAN